MDQQPTAVRQPGGWGRWRLLVALALLDLVLLGLAQGQAGNRAGLVVQFGDGTVRQTCVDLARADANGDGSVSGEEVLRAAGFPVISEVSSLGPAICKVGGDGCDYPQSSCFCQCSLVPGTTCRYWSYSRLQGNQWVFSGMGAGGTVVRPGDVEGWAWGVGTVNQGAQPPVRTFNEVCAAQAATETATATATRTRTPETPTLTPGLVFVPQVLHDLPTSTASPSATASATATRSATRAATSPPASGGAPAATATATTRPAQGQPNPTQAPSPTLAPSATTQPSPTTDSVAQQEAPTPSEEAAAALPTDTPPAAAPPASQEVPTLPLPTATEGIGLPGGEPAELPYPPAIEPTLPLAAPATPTEAATAQLLPTAAAGSVAPTAAATASTATDMAATPTAAQGAAASGGSYGQYIVFIALVALLAGGWVAARRLQGAQREGGQ